ncbi:IclR family transcriptional regulator [Thermoactinospora rubra]|uniref:IclR family transcriptional regulator n=1 Tax=Thermoactinospora rubra TaxID=1088767 RepID=UPI000A11A5D0|nr:IclR family transcriptional regulator [Thermoactinospora rubra]
MIDSSRGARRREERLVGSDRVLAVLRVLAEHPEGVGLEETARAVESPKPTVHRALASLRRAGFALQDGRGRYLLGDEFLRLAFTHHEARPDHVRVRPALERLAAAFGETAHYAVLDGRQVVYRAKVDPPSGPVRLTSTVGGRNPAHCTAVGKLLLAYALPDDAAVAAWVARGPLPRRTAGTKVTAEELAADLAAVRERGYATDDQENEEGVTCVAVPAFLTSARTPSGAVSVSALAYRTPLASLVAALPRIHAIVGEGR